MSTKVHLLTFAMLLLCITNSNTAPTKATPKENPPPSSHTTKHALEDIQLIQPHIITIEHFEELLRRAGEIFRPAAFQNVKGLAAATPTAATAAAELAQHPAMPYQHMQPPQAQPYNFYLPLFDYDDTKLDAKSRQLGQITPPPAPTDQDPLAQTDYYNVKPKKLPKKFSAIAKQVNIKWLNAFEKDALENNGNVADNENGELPTKAVYLVQDERNRINFDDSFFGVDMQVQTPADNEPHKALATVQNGGEAAHAQTTQYLNQGEQMTGEDLEENPEEEEDLLAASQVPQVNYVTVKAVQV